jgi:tetratricopeptide (TPR) repeat protein
MKITKATYILFIALTTLIIFLPSLKNDFAWDDKYLIIDNPYIKNWSYIPDIFSTQLYEGGGKGSNFYRPLQLLSFAIDYSVWGLNPFGYHLMSLILHISNSILIYLILVLISSSSSLAFLTAMLFGISPAISGITYYISARSDLLVAFFIFLSFLCFVTYIKKKKRIWHIVSIISFIAALLSKEIALILLMFLVLGFFNTGGKQKERIRMFLPYIIILITYIFLRSSILNFAKGSNPLIDASYVSSIPLYRRLLTDFKIIPRYLGLLLFPYGLHMEWFIEPARTILQIDVLFSIAIIILVIFFLKRLSRINNMALFGSLWFLLGLLPFLNIYPISVFFGEGWLYVPSVGFFIVLSIIFQDVVIPRTRKILANSLVVAVVLYYTFFTISYGRVWKDSISLLHNVLKYEQRSPFICLTHNNLAKAYYNNGDFGRSIEYCKKSIFANPRYAYPYNNLGLAYMATDNPIKAIASIRKAITLDRNYVLAYYNMAIAYNSIGLQDRAMRFLGEALRIDPAFYKGYCAAGYFFSEKGDIGRAIDFFRRAIELRMGSYEPHYYLGLLYIKKDRFKEALDEYNVALKLGFRDYKFYNELAFLYIKNNRFKEAEGALLYSMELNSSQSEVYNNLANLYSMLGYFDVAMRYYRRALDLDPDSLGIRGNIKRLKTEWKKGFKRNGS